ncbi:MAG: SCO family protein, partial [Nevskiales bacterium]
LTTSDQPMTGIGGDDGQLGGEFTLQGIDGPVSLSDFRGKVVLIYFGFVNCKKVCPSSMAVLQNSMKKLDEAQAAQVQGILISIDPARDSKADLAEFAANYHSNIIGLTGTEKQIEAVSLDYGALFEMTDAQRNDADYRFHHSSRYYVVNQQGELVDAMRHSTTSNELAARIRQLLETNSAGTNKGSQS